MASENGEGSAWYSYAVVRVVPRVERDEALNVGVVLLARTLGFLQALIDLDEGRTAAFAAELDLADLRRHLLSFEAIAGGLSEGGPIAQLPPSERFHWLTSPRSTVIQTSPVHMGRCDDPETALRDLVARLVQ